MMDMVCDELEENNNLSVNIDTKNKVIKKEDNYLDTIINKVYNHLKIILSVNSFDTKNIVHIVTELVKFVDVFYIKGSDKKQIILDAIKSFLTNENYSEENINFIVNTVCSDLIDILITVDKRKVVLTKKAYCSPWCK